MTPLQKRDLEAFWHPCAQMRDYRDFPPLPVVAAEGCRLYLEDGGEVLDAISSWWCKSLGHRHPRLMAALAQQAERFDHVIVANTTNEPLVRLCERLLAVGNGLGPEAWGPDASPGRQPGWFSRVFLADNGSTAVEIALKMALQAQVQRGQAGRTGFAALAGGYHGETVATLSVGDCDLYAAPYQPLMFPVARLPVALRSGPDDPRWLDASAEWPAVEAALAPDAGTLAAIVYEPVLQGAGGMRLVSPDLIRRLRAWADAHGVYLIADEIAAGIGRCGTMLAGEHAGVDVRPDLACLSKGLTGGVLPLSAVLVRVGIPELFDADYCDYRAFLHSNTWTGNALAVAVANAVLDVYAEEGILATVANHGPLLRDGLDRLAESRPWLGNRRAVGMFAAIDIQGREPRERTGYRVYREAVRRGALLRPMGDTMYLFPPLTTAPDDIAAMCTVLGESLDAVLGS